MPAELHAVPDTTSMDIKQKQEAYHDWEAGTYDEKFSISYDQRCIDYARDRFRKVVPEGAVFHRVLEVGAGTGFFLINLALGDCLEGATLEATDISEGMLEVCRRNGAEHGLTIATRQGDAEALPYDDDSFDLVIGHAFIHHLPVPGAAIREMHRILKPGGTLVIAGEPTEIGDKVSWFVKRNTYRAFRAATALPGLTQYRKPSIVEAGGTVEDATLAGLEYEVDLHTFRPGDVEKMARLAGFREARVVTEELTANWVGWAVRTIEGAMRPGVLGMRWAFAAFNAYTRLHRFDDRVLARFVPRDVFYNLILHATK
ncbi:methyltransferase domain-containing protein [Egicoccus sp. AB-alg6-2]|uniref:class I SAM-dependent methyltransferase n=1 Tax=Egicoccus sp. AB-alg6-2 TaxID=3242692 RepID=UPI00359DFF6A